MKKTNQKNPERIEEFERELDKKTARRKKKKSKKMKVSGKSVFELDKIMTKK